MLRETNNTGSKCHKKTHTVTVLVTGFAPFGENSVNPSSVIASLLPNRLRPDSSCKIEVKIVHYPYPICVSYATVRHLVPRLFEEYSRDVDIVLHIGMAGQRTYYSIEQQAHRDGYNQREDVYGTAPEKNDGASHWPGYPAILQTSLDFDDVFDRWRSSLLDVAEMYPEVGHVDVRPSHDPGHYLCDFIYYSMMAEYRKHRDGLRNPVDDMPVIFMHVPGSTTTEDLRKGRAVTISLIQALAESWLSEKLGSLPLDIRA